MRNYNSRPHKPRYPPTKTFDRVFKAMNTSSMDFERYRSEYKSHLNENGNYYLINIMKKAHPEQFNTEDSNANNSISSANPNEQTNSMSPMKLENIMSEEIEDDETLGNKRAIHSKFSSPIVSAPDIKYFIPVEEDKGLIEGLNVKIENIKTWIAQLKQKDDRKIRSNLSRTIKTIVSAINLDYSTPAEGSPDPAKIEKYSNLLKTQRGQDFIFSFILPVHESGLVPLMKRFFFTTFAAFPFIDFDSKSPFAQKFFSELCNYLNSKHPTSHSIKLKWIVAFIRFIISEDIFTVLKSHFKCACLTALLIKMLSMKSTFNDADSELVIKIVDPISKEISSKFYQFLSLGISPIFMRNIINSILILYPDNEIARLLYSAS